MEIIKWQEELVSIYGISGEGCLKGKEDVLKAGNTRDLLIALTDLAKEWENLNIVKNRNIPYPYPETLKLLLSGLPGWDKYSDFVLNRYIKIIRG